MPHESERIRGESAIRAVQPKPTPILFLDLDGTVRLGMAELGRFVNDPTDVEIFPGVIELLQQYKGRGWRICGVSNQGGIALHHVSIGQVSRAMAETNRLCANLFDRMIWCEHHPEAQRDTQAETLEASRCWCRKPAAGMLFACIHSLSEQYTNEFYRPYACLMVGDLPEDQQCAINANIPFQWAVDWRAGL